MKKYVKVSLHQADYSDGLDAIDLWLTLGLLPESQPDHSPAFGRDGTQGDYRYVLANDLMQPISGTDPTDWGNLFARSFRDAVFSEAGARDDFDGIAARLRYLIPEEDLLAMAGRLWRDIQFNWIKPLAAVPELHVGYSQASVVIRLLENAPAGNQTFGPRWRFALAREGYASGHDHRFLGGLGYFSHAVFEAAGYICARGLTAQLRFQDQNGNITDWDIAVGRLFDDGDDSPYAETYGHEEDNDDVTPFHIPSRFHTMRPTRKAVISQYVQEDEQVFDEYVDLVVTIIRRLAAARKFNLSYFAPGNYNRARLINLSRGLDVNGAGDCVWTFSTRDSVAFRWKQVRTRKVDMRRELASAFFKGVDHEA